VATVAATLACVDFFDRTRPLLDGTVATPGLALACTPLPPKELAQRWTEFDVAEAILPVYLARRAQGDESYIGIPVFPYRAFFFANLLVHRDSGIERPADLHGRRVGTPSLHMAGTVWTRGILQDEYGVDGTRLRWVQAGPPRGTAPAGLSVESVPDEGVLSDLLAHGELDAYLGSNTPACWEQGAPTVRRLFPDYRAAEETYARRTRALPIIHAVVVRRALYEAHSWVARTLLTAFQQARAVGLARLRHHGVFACGLPWLRDDLETLPRLFDGDPFQHGFARNRAVLATLARYCAEQGLVSAAPDVATLFAPETLD
jgi:4,5-dihydroxyphthalate decarboxylase